MVWYQGNACSFRFYLSSSSFPTIPLRSADSIGLKNFPALLTWLLLVCGWYVIFFRLTSKLTPHRRSLGVLEHNRQLKLGAVPSMQQAAISGDPLKREDQVEDIKRYAFGTKGCLHLRYQNLNVINFNFDLEDSPWQGSRSTCVTR